MSAVLEQAKPIQLMIFDVDGVMTDGTLYLGDNGQEYKAFNSLDGHGLKMLKTSGVTLAIITGRRSPVVALRAADIGITHLHQDASDKLAVYRRLLSDLGLAPEASAYMGDDVIDLPVMRRCGLAITVPAAPSLVQAHAHYVTVQAGGCGAVREACELIMRTQGTLDTILAHYLE